MGKTELTVATVDDKLARIDDITRHCAVLSVSKSVADAYKMASDMFELRALFTGQVLERLLSMQGTPLGFLTDKDSQGGYPGDKVRDCIIEACARGLRVLNNEFNIIAGRVYITRNGYERLCHDYPGMRDLKVLEGKIEMVGNAGAYVPMKATWLLNGIADSIEVSIPVKVNSGMGADAIIGKAFRKMYARVYTRITGSYQSDSDEQLVDDVIESVEGSAA